MIGKEAKNKLITSRWGDSVPDATQLRETAQAAGCNLEIRSCDISDGHSLMQLLHEYSESIPPIHDMVQGAIPLDISLSLAIPSLKSSIDISFSIIPV